MKSSNNQKWTDEVTACILQYNPNAEIIDKQSFPELIGKVVYVGNKNIVYHLLPIPFNEIQDISPTYFQERSLEYIARGVQLVHLWQDCWVAKPEIVRSRIAALSGAGIRIHARRTNVWRITKDDTFGFFAANHLQGAVNARYNYGLYHEKQIVAEASFSAGRTVVRNGITHRSFELLRFANLLHHVVAGGLGKMIARFVKDINPGDIMTYADLDWASGKGYRELNFEQTAVTPPQALWVHPADMIRYYPHRLPLQLTEAFKSQNRFGNINDFLTNKGYIKIYNAGNLKYLKNVPKEQNVDNPE